MYSQGDEGLGAVPLALVGAGTSVLQSLLPTGFQTSKQRDKQRNKDTDAVYARAIQGDADAMALLLQRSKSLATKPAKAYAAKKYAAAVKAVAASPTGSASGSAGVGSLPITKAGFSPLMLGAGVVGAVLITSLMKRR